MSAGYAPCSCQQAEELAARVRELEALLETAAAELDKRDEHLGKLRKRTARLQVALGCVANIVHYADETAIADIRTVVTEALKETP
jgi:hypothetical protein